jgi:hypothetical protein
MNGTTNDQFIHLFGQPSRLYYLILGTLVVLLGIALIYLIRKAWNDRENIKDFGANNLFIVVGRALILILAFTAIFNIR